MIEGQLEAHRFFHRQIGRLRAFEDAVHEVGQPSHVVNDPRPVRHENAGLGHFAERDNGGQPVFESLPSYPYPLGKHHALAQDQQRVDLVSGDRGESTVEGVGERTSANRSVTPGPRALNRGRSETPDVAG
jgi:hypothetical protein